MHLNNLCDRFPHVIMYEVFPSTYPQHQQDNARVMHGSCDLNEDANTNTCLLAH